MALFTGDIGEYSYLIGDFFSNLMGVTGQGYSLAGEARTGASGGDAGEDELEHLFLLLFSLGG